MCEGMEGKGVLRVSSRVSCFHYLLVKRLTRGLSYSGFEQPGPGRSYSTIACDGAPGSNLYFMTKNYRVDKAFS